MNAGNPYQSPDTLDARQSDGIPRYDKIGGWLVLLSIGLTLSVVRVVFVLFGTYLPIFTDGHFAAVTDPASPSYHPLLGPLILFETVSNVAIGVLVVWLLVLMFRRSRLFPLVTIAFLVANVLFSLVDLGLGSLIPAVAARSDNSESLELGRSVIFGLIWSLYLSRSKRVRGTFVH